MIPDLAPISLRNRSCHTPLRLRRREIPLFVKWEDYVPTYLSSIHNVSFVLVGASCGANVRDCAIGGDPIWNYAVSCGWHGVAVEPIRRMFARLCHHYGRFSRHVTPLHALVTGFRGDVVVADRGETSRVVRLPQRTNNTYGTLSDRYKWRASHLASNEEVVSSLTLRDIWPIPHGAAVLVVDAEGSEKAILGEADLPSPLPHLVLFEFVYLSNRTQQLIDINLRRQGFIKLGDLKHRDRNAELLRLGAQDRLYGRRRLGLD